jgi:DNA-binding CsgD family transcriptional regulator
MKERDVIFPESESRVPPEFEVPGVEEIHFDLRVAWERLREFYEQSQSRSGAEPASSEAPQTRCRSAERLRTSARILGKTADPTMIAIVIEVPEFTWSRWDELTRRQRDVSRLIADGLSNVEIGVRLRVKTATIASHLTKIYGVLGVKNRTQLARLVFLRSYFAS